jgi:CheY-like chemotaxis protein
MCIVLLSRDLILLARTQGAANKLGVALHNAADPVQACSLIQANQCRGVVIDLRVPALQLQELVPEFRLASEQLTVIACGPHVHEASLTAAREAGCDVVVTRGQFERDAEAILADCLNDESA